MYKKDGGRRGLADKGVEGAAALEEMDNILLGNGVFLRGGGRVVGDGPSGLAFNFGHLSPIAILDLADVVDVEMFELALAREPGSLEPTPRLGVDVIGVVELAAELGDDDVVV